MGMMAFLSPADPWFYPAVGLAAAAVVSLGLWAIARIVRDAGRAGVAVVHATGDAATKVAEGLARVLRDTFNLQPRVTIAGQTKIEGPQTARELVLLKQTLERSHEWSNQRLWSTKRLLMSARFTVSVGYDLTHPIAIDVARDGSKAKVSLPPARILAVQLDALNPAEEESGWWNRITPTDRAAVQQEMQRLVETDARESGLLAQAEEEFRRVLATEMGKLGGNLEFTPLPRLPAPDLSAAAKDSATEVPR